MNQLNLNQKLTQLFLVISLVFSVSLFAQDGDVANSKQEVKKETAEIQKVDPLVTKGKKIFKANCTSCHKLEKAFIGPPLLKVTDKYSREWLHAWIKDNNALRKTGDADAKAIFEEYNKSPMTTFPQLSEEDIDAMLAYFKVGNVKRIIADGGTDVVEEKGSDAWMSWIVAIALIVLLIYMLFVSKNGFIKIVAIIALILTITYLLFNALLGIGVDQDYQPIQPIAFSHKVHAGDNKIDCQYCHSSAKHSKTSGVPTANICMNCHKNISEYTGTDGNANEDQKKFYTAEIQKIYDAVGWDPDNFKYKENYEAKPIKWVRVHNLPDFVYYNHSQHVTVAGLKCQKCHGPVEEMEELYQYSPLTMGWCLDCHKESEVNMNNKYYKKIHEELSKKYNLEKVTIADIGGKECGKCHY